MILENIHGKQPSKRLKDSSFNDIHYVEELLFCVFNALDIGQKSLGFHHAGRCLKLALQALEVLFDRPGLSKTYKTLLLHVRNHDFNQIILNNFVSLSDMHDWKLCRRPELL